MAVISRAQLQSVTASGTAVITDVKHLSSYNWIESPTPSIVVPGMPALWVAPDGPRKLARDSGFFYTAQNAARHPDYPLEPLFRSLYAENEFFDISSVSVITERNSIRKLLSLIIPDSYRKEARAFTIGVEVIKDTVVFRREEAATHEILGPGDYRGHGHEFEKAYTVRRVDGSTGYHRVISYQFCDLKFLVCHETDAYIEETSDSRDSTVDELAIPLTAYTSINDSKLRIAKGGKAVPLHSVLEIKTRTRRKPLAIRDVAPQLWISQTPNLVRAYHYYGEFDKAQSENIAAQIQEWEKENQPALEKLGWLIKQITAITKDCGGQSKVEYDPRGDRLVVSPDCGKRMLPADLYSKWNIGSSYRELETAISENGGDVTAEVKETRD
ncbi:hypothetical protein MY11210_003281 [Beauveria gryllotalpidicola]